MKHKEYDKKLYDKPEIIYELELETTAGSIPPMNEFPFNTPGSE